MAREGDPFTAAKPTEHAQRLVLGYAPGPARNWVVLVLGSLCLVNGVLTGLIFVFRARLQPEIGGAILLTTLASTFFLVVCVLVCEAFLPRRIPWWIWAYTAAVFLLSSAFIILFIGFMSPII